MTNQIFDILLGIPQYLAQFGSWLTTPINEQFFNISPLGLFGVGGGAFVIALLGIHIIKLFI